MRWVTYLGLVLRRVWARRGMLLGSFLGATLVIALLAVLPLYEASVSAIDLLFTFRQAPDATVDLNAALTLTEYSPEEADAGRDTVAAASAAVAAWYPTVEERTVSRELVMIPLEYPDWLGLAAAWREAGSPPEEAPWPQPPREASQTRLFTAPDLAAGLALLEGGLPEFVDPAGSAAPILEVVIGEELARLNRLEIGDRVVLRAFASLPREFEMVEVVGIARPANPDAVIWDGIDPARLTFLTPESFDVWTGAFAADPEADPWQRTERGFRRLTATRSFTLHLDRETVTLEAVGDLKQAILYFRGQIAREGGIILISQLPGLIEAFGVRTVVFGAPILAMLALVVAGALYFLIYMAALALEREAAELALLRMRGASTWQTIGIHSAQSAVIALGAAVVAPFVARGLVALSGRVPPMSTLTGGSPLSVSQARSVVPFVLAGGILTFTAMGLAIVPLARRGVLELRALASRPARQSVWQRYYLDVFLVVLAAVVLYELRQRGLVGGTGREVGLDPFSVAAPALFLFSGALLLLRVLPLLLRAIGWVMTRFRGMAAALPGWHLGRNPVPYGRLALLVWLTTGFGAFALTYADTLDASYHDRAAFRSGGDVRLVAEGAGFLTVPEGAVGTPVYRTVGAARLTSRSQQVLAVDPAAFVRVVHWREDYGDLALLGPEGLGEAADWGVELPPGTTALEVEAVQEPRTWAAVEAGEGAEQVRLLLRAVDDRGRLRTFVADAPLDDQAWSTVVVDLRGTAARNGPFSDDGGYLVLQALWLEREPGGTGPAVPETRVYLGDLRAVTGAGPVSVFASVQEEFAGLQGLEMEMVDGEAAVARFFAERPAGSEAPSAAALRDHPLWRSGLVARLAVPERARPQEVPHLARPAEPLPFVLDAEAARVSGLAAGQSTLFGVDGKQVEGWVAGLVELIPTAVDPRLEGAMVTRRDGLVQWLSGAPSWSISGTLAKWTQPQEMWLRADDINEAAGRLAGQLATEPDELLTTAGVSAEFSSRPIQVGLVSILFIGTGAGVVLTLAGVTAYVLMAVRRRFREMGVLRALGLRRRSVAATFAVEQLVVLGVGAIVGIGAGVALMRLMLPFLQLGEGGAALLPPALMQLDWARLAMYLGVVAVVLVTAVLWSTRNVSARQLSEVLREVER
ncbi:MAG: ABC transporter permease [Actinobacteria bacterium]|nr:ABC transporter permease [Actinomycetota bacterium]